MSTMTSAPAIAARRRMHDWMLAQPEPVTTRQVAEHMGWSVTTAGHALGQLETQDLVVRDSEPRSAGGGTRIVTVWTGVHRLPTDLVPLRASLQPATEALLCGATADEVARLCSTTRDRALGDLRDMARHGYVEERGGLWWATPDGRDAADGRGA